MLRMNLGKGEPQSGHLPVPASASTDGHAAWAESLTPSASSHFATPAPLPPQRYDARVTSRRLANSNAAKRRAQILTQLREHGHVSVSTLAVHYDVTEMTIRRDLRKLSDDGLATLVHGGARIPAGTGPLAFAARVVDQAAEKQRLGRLVASQLTEVPVLGIDAGTTTLEVAIHLPPDYRGTVVTHSVPALAALTGKTAAHTIGIGGDLIPETQALASNSSLQLLRELHLSVFLLGANGLNANGVYVRTALELDIKRAYIAAAERVHLIVDATKVGSTSAVRVCALDQVDEIITNAPLPPDIASAARRAGTIVRIP